MSILSRFKAPPKYTLITQEGELDIYFKPITQAFDKVCFESQRNRYRAYLASYGLKLQKALEKGEEPPNLEIPQGYLESVLSMIASQVNYLMCDGEKIDASEEDIVDLFASLDLNQVLELLEAADASPFRSKGS